MDFYPEFRALLKKAQINQPTTIQRETEKLLREGENVVGLAKTGTGKTLAFALPLLLQVQPGSANSLVIFEPTTELAIQVRDAIQNFAKQQQLKVTALVGAGNRQRQIEVLKKKHPEVIVATPGRFFDMLTEKRIKPEQIKHLVIDEADDILESMKLELLVSLAQNLAVDSQVVLFGATESKITQDADQIFERNFVKVDVRNVDESKVEHLFIQVDNQHKLDTLSRLARVDQFSGIVFFNSIKNLEHFAGILSHTKIKFSVLSNAASKQARRIALKELETKQVKMLLATDLAARGLDVPRLTYVINYELPEDLNTYTHRAGRTGRVMRSGRVVSLGTDHDLRNLRKVLGTEIELSRAYFDGFELTTKKPTPKAKSSANKQTEKKTRVDEKTTPKTEFKQATIPTKKKKKKTKQKNKGYHPHGAKKKDQVR